MTTQVVEEFTLPVTPSESAQGIFVLVESREQGDAEVWLVLDAGYLTKAELVDCDAKPRVRLGSVFKSRKRALTLATKWAFLLAVPMIERRGGHLKSAAPWVKTLCQRPLTIVV